MKQVNRTIQFKNRRGLHMRPAAEVAKIAGAHEAQIVVSVDGNRADARSIFELLILGVQHGDLLEVSAVGCDAEQALIALGGFLDAYCDCDAGADSFAA